MIETKVSLLDLVKETMIEEGLKQNWIKIEGDCMYYHIWFLCAVRESKFYMLPFKTNEVTWLNPADPEFFALVRKAVEIPKESEPFGNTWARWQSEGGEPWRRLKR